ncbi:uncharacterized protein ISCGN_026966 [Ixodes scapularis]
MSIDERPGSKTTRAIVLKPVCKEAVNGFRARDIRQAAEAAGIESQEDFKIQYQTKTNTITLTTQEGTAEKLIRLKAIEKNGKQCTVCPYRAMEKNQIRGVIYPPGDNSEETPETLLADMKCDKARIIAARLMGKGTSAVRLQALQRYRKNRTLHLKIKLKRAAAKARQYCKQLGRERWRTHCGSFNARNGLGRAWRTYKGLNGAKRKTRNAAQNLALKLNISEAEMAIRAGELFFPQEEDRANQKPVAMNTRTPEEEGMEDPLNMGELIEAIYTAKTGSAPGPDGVTYQALRNLPEESKQKLLDKYNTVWEEGMLPRAWKLSWVTPIPKPGKLLDRIENMRPASLTSNICKTMEKIVLRRIQWYLEKHERLDPRQTGFREAMGTQDSLRLLYEEVLAEKDKQDPRLVVALDIRKAFDSVPHWAVVREAKACGIRGRTLYFIRDFLRDRRFQVKIGETMGPETPSKTGVPQGAVLSPTLFNMHPYVPPDVAALVGPLPPSRGHCLRICRILRSEAWRQIRFFKDCIHEACHREAPFDQATRRVQRELQTASRITEVQWLQILATLPKKRECRSPEGQAVHVIGNTDVPDKARRVLCLGPKFCNQPELSKPELLSMIIKRHQFDSH